MADYLVTGAGGQVGQALLKIAPGSVAGLTRADLDVSDPVAVRRTMADIRPAVVLHAAAWTDVDACEGDPARAWLVNAEGTANLARVCAAQGARLLYVSTDYVFPGDANRPYQPDDPVGPRSVYGKSKLGGELAVRLLLPHAHSIVRTSWVFAAEGRNFVNTIVRLAKSQSELRVVNDQRGRPTFAGDLAEWLWLVVEGRVGGTLHACNAHACSWYEFALGVLAQRGLHTPVLPVATSEFPRPAPRPAYSVLDTACLEQALGVQPRGWRAALAASFSVDPVRANDPVAEPGPR